ncbi:SURF1-like protein [Megalopta genalis]|uniref:SURF1-like protein n=1 Tax=Megalopta genalis TaxID=115081 RepID=UPI003FD4C2D1
MIRSGKRFKTRLSKPNLYVSKNKARKFIELPATLGPYGYFLLSIPIGTFLLGTWQVKRLKWKVNLIQNLNERISHEALQLPNDLQQLEEMEYYPFKVKGIFLYDQEFPIGPRSLIMDGDSSTRGSFLGNKGTYQGYYIVTPFKFLQQLEEMEYYPFKVKGAFLYDQEFLIGPRSLTVDGDSSTQGSFLGNKDTYQGYYIITPFKLSDQE